MGKTWHVAKILDFNMAFSTQCNCVNNNLWENMKIATDTAALSASGRKKGGQTNKWYKGNPEILDPLRS